MKPYYDHKGIQIFLGDCRDILPELEPVDLVLTDPPYPDYHAELYKYEDGLIDCLNGFCCKQFVFWSAKVDFPLDYTAIHIWDKKTGAGSQYERIFERNGNEAYEVYRYYLINSTVAASYTQDVFTGHKSQKPINLIKRLLEDNGRGRVCDPFMGSGTTLVACKQLGRKAIGIELEEKYVEIAIRRLSQEMLPFNMPVIARRG